jgi:hypothetical protein
VFFKPDIIALFVGSFLIGGLLLYGAFFGLQILRTWDLHSGSERQLRLERRTYLISTVMAYACALQLFSLFLFIFTADRLHPFFTGAMCAVGSLNVNEYGNPVIILKVINFLLAGLWLIVNYTDNRGFDYPLIKKKYILLLAMTPLILVEAVMQGKYFMGMEPEIITSCCGTVFSSGGKGIASELAGLPSRPLEIAFGLSLAGTFAGGLWFYRTGKGGYLFSVTSFVAFLISLGSVIAFISTYIYELPTHHCPFCILQGEYHYVGYPIYLLLMTGAITGLGVGTLLPFKHLSSLKDIIPSILKQLVTASLLSYAVFLLIIIYQLLSSNLK